jgi:hypothetical protein
MKDRFITFTSIFLLLAACALALFTVYLCYALEWRGPMRDLWEFVEIIESLFQGNWDWQALLQPYGGIHRIFLPKLMFYLDYRFFHGSNLFSLTLTLLLHIGSAALVISTIFKNHTLKNRELILLTAISLLFFFSTTQIYNLIYNSDNQVVISHAIAILATWCFYKNKLISAHILVMLACLSHSSSLMLLPAMSLVLFCQGAPRRILIWQIIFSITLLLVYVSGQDPLNASQITLPLWKRILSALYAFAVQLEGILRYIGLYLSSPTSRMLPIPGILISYLSIVYLAFKLFNLYRQKSLSEPSDIFWLTLACYIFFVALVTAYGRQFYPNSALTDRYQTLVMTYWLAILILLYLDLKQKQEALGLLSPFAALLLLMPHQLSSATEMAWLSSRVTRAHTAAMIGITDMDTIAATLSHPLLMDNKNLVAKHNDFLRQQRLGYFSYPESIWFHTDQNNRVLNQTIESSAACSATVTQVKLLKPGQFRLEGRATVAGRPTTDMLLVDNQQKIIGYARDMRQKGEFRPLTWRNPENTHWVGFINSDEIDFPVSLLGKKQGRYCVLTSIKKESFQKN